MLDVVLLTEPVRRPVVMHVAEEDAVAARLDAPLVQCEPGYEPGGLDQVHRQDSHSRVHAERLQRGQQLQHTAGRQRKRDVIGSMIRGGIVAESSD